MDVANSSYRLYLTEGDRFLLASKKQKKTKTNYTISLDENDISKQSGNYFGKVGVSTSLAFPMTILRDILKTVLKIICKSDMKIACFYFGY